MSLPAQSDSVKTCVVCGASVYQEHLDRGLAGMWAGEMLCPHCMAERQQTDAGSSTGSGPDSLPLMEESAAADYSDPASVPGGGDFGDAVAAALEGEPAEGAGGRPGKGARRVRIFHCKLSEGATTHLGEQVNGWLESHPEIEIKFATTTVGVWEGKHSEPNLILTVFY